MLIVKKFGGSSVANKERIFRVAERCIEDYRAGHDVVVVLSAMGDTTDDLIAMAHSIQRVGYAPDHRRTGIRIPDGYGYAEPGCTCSIAECVSGADAFYRTVWQCKIQED